MLYMIVIPPVHYFRDFFKRVFFTLNELPYFFQSISKESEIRVFQQSKMLPISRIAGHAMDQEQTYNLTLMVLGK